ncbi:NADP-dependent 3-hydroxy acid dehydrogenase YdfG [Gammaproteobacteria bacterium]
MSVPLKNKVVLITGASSGIGKACALVFAKHGARLILCARRYEHIKKLSSFLKTTYNVETYLLPLDVQDRTMVEKGITNLPTAWKDIDILINNAGLALGLDKIQTGDVSNWEKMIDTNIKGLLYATHSILPNMVRRNQGHIINIGSIAGYEVGPASNVYSATKHAVRALTKGMKIDLLGTKIRVSSVDPGMVKTEFSEVRFDGNKEKAEKVYEGIEPLVAEDIADIVYYCASRPQNINIFEIVVMPVAQASVNQVYRSSE